MSKWFILLSFLAVSAHAQTENWKIDETHASVVFKANHLGFSNTYGMFRDVSGNVKWDAAKPENSSFDITIKADSLDTMNKKRDDHLKNADFFNVKQYPNITLKSKSVKKTGANTYDVTADLSMHGVTKPLKFVLTHMKTGEDPWKNMRTGGETKFTVKRSDFNMKYMLEGISDEIEVIVSLEALKAK